MPTIDKPLPPPPRDSGLLSTSSRFVSASPEPISRSPSTASAAHYQRPRAPSPPSTRPPTEPPPPQAQPQNAQIAVTYNQQFDAKALHPRNIFPSPAAGPSTGPRIISMPFIPPEKPKDPRPALWQSLKRTPQAGPSDGQWKGALPFATPVPIPEVPSRPREGAKGKLLGGRKNLNLLPKLDHDHPDTRLSNPAGGRVITNLDDPQPEPEPKEGPLLPPLLPSSPTVYTDAAYPAPRDTYYATFTDPSEADTSISRRPARRSHPPPPPPGQHRTPGRRPTRALPPPASQARWVTFGRFGPTPPPSTYHDGGETVFSGAGTEADPNLDHDHPDTRPSNPAGGRVITNLDDPQPEPEPKEGPLLPPLLPSSPTVYTDDAYPAPRDTYGATSTAPSEADTSISRRPARRSRPPPPPPGQHRTPGRRPTRALPPPASQASWVTFGRFGQTPVPSTYHDGGESVFSGAGTEADRLTTAGDRSTYAANRETFTNHRTAFVSGKSVYGAGGNIGGIHSMDLLSDLPSRPTTPDASPTKTRSDRFEPELESPIERPELPVGPSMMLSTVPSQYAPESPMVESPLPVSEPPIDSPSQPPRRSTYAETCQTETYQTDDFSVPPSPEDERPRIIVIRADSDCPETAFTDGEDVEQGPIDQMSTRGTTYTAPTGMTDGMPRDTTYSAHTGMTDGMRAPRDTSYSAQTGMSDDDPLDLESLIGSVSSTAVSVNGHFCDVFQGVHSIAGKVALKRPRLAGTDYDGDTIRRFEREAATWKHLRHPHILEFIGTLKRDGHLYLVSPFIANGTLVEYLSRHPDVKRIRLLRETADAIQYLQRQNVVHGDIKGMNILISEDAHVLLCDFGLTKMIDSRTSTCAKGAGSVRWMSPELWDNEPRTFESDVYAFGMTIAEVLTGQAPLSHLSTSMAVMMAVMGRNERPLRNPTSSPDGESYEEAWNVAAACWPTSPSERISIAEAHHRLLTEHAASRWSHR